MTMWGDIIDLLSPKTGLALVLLSAFLVVYNAILRSPTAVVVGNGIKVIVIAFVFS